MPFTTYTPKSGGQGKTKITISADKNTTGGTRTEYIKFTQGSKSVVLTVIQEVEPQIEYQFYPANYSMEIDYNQLGAKNVIYWYGKQYGIEKWWLSTNLPDWIRLSPDESNTEITELSFLFTENTGEERRAILTFTDWNKTFNIEIVQKAKKEDDIYFITDKNTIEFEKSGTPSQELVITTNTDWALKSKCDWLTLSNQSGYDGDVIFFDGENHYTINEKWFTGWGKEEVKKQTVETVNLNATTVGSTTLFNNGVVRKQGGNFYTIATKTSSTYFSSVNNSGYIEIDDKKYVVDVDEPYSVGSTISKIFKLKETTGSSDETKNVFTNGNFWVFPSLIKAADGTFYLILATNITTISTRYNPTKNIIETVESGGSGEHTVIIYASENPDNDSRVCDLCFTYNDVNTKCITIRQKGKEKPAPELSFDKDNFNFEYEGGTDTVCVTSNVDWEIDAVCDWITLSPMRGSSGKTCLEIRTVENETTAERNCTICANYEGGTKCFKVNQQGKQGPQPPESCELSVSKTSVNVNWNTNGYSPYNEPIYVSSKCEWFVDKNCDWITLVPNAGDPEDVLFYIQPSWNESESDRSCVVTVRTDYGDSIDITVYQTGKPVEPEPEDCLTVSPTTITFESEGGDTNITITSCGDWTIE